MRDGILPWGTLYAALVGRRVTADRFWLLSVPELLALNGPRPFILPRSALDDLMQKFPDKEE